jgi:hypothetical protein
MRGLACLAVWLVSVGVAAAQPGVSSSAARDGPIAVEDGRLGQSTPGPAAPQRPSRTWTVSVVTGLPSRGPLDDLEHYS